MQVSVQKQRVIKEVQPVIELLREIHDTLAALPRSATAARQLGVLTNKLETWKLTFEPTDSSVVDSEDEVVDQHQIDLNSPETKRLVTTLLTTLRQVAETTGR
jgi:hypothetical protein